MSSTCRNCTSSSRIKLNNLLWDIDVEIRTVIFTICLVLDIQPLTAEALGCGVDGPWVIEFLNSLLAFSFEPVAVRKLAALLKAL